MAFTAVAFAAAGMLLAALVTAVRATFALFIAEFIEAFISIYVLEITHSPYCSLRLM
jgi:hypothetical protein